MEAKVSVGTKEVLKNINKAYLRVGLYVTRGDGVGQKSEAAKRQSVVTGFLRHKWKKSITAGNTRGAMVSKKNVKCNTQLHNKGDHYVTHEGPWSARTHIALHCKTCYL